MAPRSSRTSDLALDFDGAGVALGGIGGLSGVAVFSVDAQTRFVGWSLGAEELTGYTAEEVRGRRCDLLDGANCTGFRDLSDAIRSEAPPSDDMGTTRCQVSRADGAERTVVGSARILRNEGGAVIGAVAVLVDVTEALAGAQGAERPPAPRSAGALVGSSRAMQEVFRLIRTAAGSDVTTVITGESGVGKELCARAIHAESDRSDGPFVALNCAAIPETLLESELFGHARGAFTGADVERDGLFLAARGGTLFLDELAELPPRLQAKLLRVLQERTVQRLGETEPRPIDVRLLAATHGDLRAEVSAGRMRDDFYYRVAVFEIHIPPLRERPEDIPALADSFGRALAAEQGRAFEGFSVDAVEAMVRYPWPGNGRELRNAVERALVVATSARIGIFELPPGVRGGDAGAAHGQVVAPLSPAQEAEKVQILDALDAHGWNRTRTAEALGVSRVTLWKKMRRFRIDEGVFRRATRRRRDVT